MGQKKRLDITTAEQKAKWGEYRPTLTRDECIDAVGLTADRALEDKIK